MCARGRLFISFRGRVMQCGLNSSVLGFICERSRMNVWITHTSQYFELHMWITFSDPDGLIFSRPLRRPRPDSPKTTQSAESGCVSCQENSCGDHKAAGAELERVGSHRRGPAECFVIHTWLWSDTRDARLLTAWISARAANGHHAALFWCVSLVCVLITVGKSSRYSCSSKIKGQTDMTRFTLYSI